MPQPVFIPLAAGVQSELADQLVQPGATLALENCVSPQTGSVEARLGADILSTSSQATIPAGGTLPEVWQLATLEGQLVRFNRAPIPLHTWAQAAKSYVVPTNDGGLETMRRGPIKLDTTPVFSGTAQVGNPTVAVSTDTIVCVYRIDTGVGVTSGTATVIMDRRSRRPAFTRRTLNNLGTPRVTIVGTRAVVAYEAGGFLQIDSYNLTTYALAQQVTLGALLTGTPIDMRAGSPVVGANNIAILYRDNAGVLKCATVDATNLATNSTFGPRTTAAANVSPDLAFGWMQDFGLSGKFSIMIADTTNGLRTLWDLPAPAAGFSNATATHVLDAGATAAPAGFTPGIRNIIGTTITNSATGVYRVLYEMTATSVKTTAQIKIAVWNGAASTGVQYRSVGIRSKFWQHSTHFYFLAAFDGDDQRSYFVLAMPSGTALQTQVFDGFMAPLAVSLPRDAGGFTESVSMPSDVVTDVDGSIFMGVTEQTLTDLSVAAGGTGTGTEQRLFGVDLVRVRHPVTAETEFGRSTEFIRSLFVPGGLLGKFDGAVYDSACFPYFPPNTLAGAASQAGGALAATATYAYRFVYAEIDRNGRIWRSAPSAPIITATTGVNKQFLVTVDTLRLVDRGLASGAVGHWIEGYRTQGNAPGAYFQVFVVANDPTNDTISVTDNVPDVNVGEELYTDGGGLENQLLPSVSNAVEFQGRLIVAQAGTGTIWWSLDADLDHGLIFNEAFTLDVGDPADPITGLAVFGEQLFAFKASQGRVYVVNGDGGNALGQGITYNFRLIEPSVGCSNPQSIVVADDGVWFRSSAQRAGIHRIAGGAAEYVGGGVHAFDNLTITGAVVVKHLTQIRFYTLEGTTLIWDWTTKIWGTSTGQPCLSAVSSFSAATGVVYAKATGGSVLSEATAGSAAPYQEGAATYAARLRSPWYQSGIGAWQRIRRIQGVGTMATGRQHKAQIALYKDMNGTTPFQTATIQFDGTEKRWFWEMRPAQQKATAMLIEVTILPYQRPTITIQGNGSDSYNGAGAWTFVNGNFTSADVGAVLVFTGTPAGKAGTYTILSVGGSDTVTMTPNPADVTPGAMGGTHTMVETPAPQYTAGPGILGVSLVPVAKDGADKLPAARRTA